MKHTAKAVLALASVATLALSACGGGGTNGASGAASQSAKNSNKTAMASWNPQPRDNIKDGGTLTYGINEITPQLNPWHSDMTVDTGDIAKWYTPNPTYYTPEGDFKIDPDWLTSANAETKDGKTVMTVDINPKAKWNDGSDIDWTSYEAAWKACGEVNPDAFNCNSTDGLNQIESVKQGKDAKEAVVTFKGPFVWWQSIAGDMMNPHLTDPDVFNKGFTNNQAHPEWGAGPFKLDSIDEAGGTVQYSRNDKWWGAPAKLEKVTLKALEPNATINAFKNGQLDFAYVANKDYLEQVKGMQGIDIRRGNLTAKTLLSQNTNSDILKDIKVRQAVFEGVNRKTLADIRFQGLDYSEDAPGSFIQYAFQKGYHDNVAAAGMAYDPNAANKLLDDAGWAKGSDGIRAKDGKKLSLHMPIFGDAALTKNIATGLQAMLKQIGVDLIIDSKAASDFSKVASAKDFDILLSGFSDGDPFGVLWMCQTYCSNTSLNKSGAGTKELDQEIKDISKLDSQQAQIDQANKVEVDALKRYGILPIYNGPRIVAVKNGLANFGASVFGFGYPIQSIGWQK